MNDGLAAPLREIKELLEAAEIPYMIVGSFASTVHGEPRTTQDLDIVIDPLPSALDYFLAHLDMDSFYVDPDTARDALIGGGSRAATRDPRSFRRQRSPPTTRARTNVDTGSPARDRQRRLARRGHVHEAAALHLQLVDDGGSGAHLVEGSNRRSGRRR